MAKTDYYTINTDPNDVNHFIVHVVDKDLDMVKEYNINGSSCECWAGQKWCRHKQMLVMFKKDNLLNSRKYYNFDKKQWLEQPKGDQDA